MKRAFDILFAACVLAIASPALLFIAVWIRLDSTGPALFTQTRVGRGGSEFEIRKFRTMRIGAQGPSVTVGRDPRITRSGRFLRMTKLDEVPQLLNVIEGSMSLVGPRPEVPEYVAIWPADMRELILSVRPGITDPASILYRDESSLLAEQQEPERFYREVLMPRKLQIYRDYVLHATFRGDLKLMFVTVGLLLDDRRRRLGRSQR